MTHIIVPRSHGTKHSFCGSLPCTEKDLAQVKKTALLFNIWSLVKDSPGESHCRDQQGICYVLCILFFFFKGGNYAMWTIRDGAKDSLLFELNSKTDKAELYRIALMSFTHCVTPI